MSGRCPDAKVAESLFRKATGDHRQSVTAAIFLLKTRARWREAKEDPAPETQGPIVSWRHQ